LAVGTEVAPLCGVIKTSRLGGKEDMAPEPASDQRDTVKDTELIVSVLNGDVDRIHRMVLAALGLAAVFVTQIPLSQLRALPEFFRVLAVIAVGLLTLAAVLLFRYTQQLNDTRQRLANAALGDPPPNMQKEWKLNLDPANEERIKWVWPLTWGTRLLGLGGLFLGVVVARLLLG
jgi:hypothetical protein